MLATIVALRWLTIRLLAVALLRLLVVGTGVLVHGRRVYKIEKVSLLSLLGQRLRKLLLRPEIVRMGQPRFEIHSKDN